MLIISLSECDKKDKAINPKEVWGIANQLYRLSQVQDYKNSSYKLKYISKQSGRVFRIINNWTGSKESNSFQNEKCSRKRRIVSFYFKLPSSLTRTSAACWYGQKKWMLGLALALMRFTNSPRCSLTQIIACWLRVQALRAVSKLSVSLPEATMIIFA